MNAHARASVERNGAIRRLGHELSTDGQDPSEGSGSAGVSLSTASRVLGGSRDRVTPHLRGRVLAAAEELNYVPNAPARALVRATTSTLGLLVHDVGDPYFAEIARGVLRVADEAALMVMISNSYRDPERELDYIQALRAQRVQAIVLAGSGYRDARAERETAVELRAFEATGGRVAVVGRHRLPVDAILPDNAQGAQPQAAAPAAGERGDPTRVRLRRHTRVHRHPQLRATASNFDAQRPEWWWSSPSSFGRARTPVLAPTP